MKFGIREYTFEEGDPCVVIGEVGVNHNGDPDIARQLVDVAVNAKVDIVKFQSFKSEKEISRYAPKALYQEETTSSKGNQLDMCKALELSGDVLLEMQDYCSRRKVGFLCTAFESESVDLLIDKLRVDTIKIPSGEVTNIPLLEYIGSRCRAAVLSTGASTLAEVGSAIEALRKGGCEELLLLHCVTSYPAEVADVNLRAMETMRRAFLLPVGFSDHTPGINVPIAAAALGASAVEKHFTIDRNMPGPDHRASIEPDELAKLVQGIRQAQLALGSTVKQPQRCELPNITLIRKGLVASRHLKAGQRLDRNMIDIKRPALGILPADLSKVLGMTLTADVDEDAPIRWDDLR
jgi:N-acetylneuraminate synthase